MTVISNRKIDDLGRIVLPLEIRTKLNLKRGDSLSICLDDSKVVLMPNHNYCALCKTTENLNKINSYFICSGCKEKIINMGL